MSSAPQKEDILNICVNISKACQFSFVKGTCMRVDLMFVCFMENSCSCFS